MELAPDFDEFIGCLTAHGVEFVVVGAYALAFHGAPRFTGDLDLLIQPTTDNAERLIGALGTFGFATELTPDAIADHRRMIEMGVPPVQIYLMSAISGVEWDQACFGSVDGRLGSHRVHFLGHDAFLRNKRAAGRPKDLADVDALEHRFTAVEVLRRYKEELLQEFVERPLENVSDVGNSGNCPIHIAATRGSLEELRALIEGGADVNAVGEHGHTPLHEAVRQGHLEASRLLLVSGARLADKNAWGDTALAIAKRYKRGDLIALLEKQSRD